MTLTGWLLDLYSDPQGQAALWLLCDDGARRRLRLDCPVTFYAAGPAARLRQAWGWLAQQQPAPALSRTERRDLFQPDPLPMLAVQVRTASTQPALFQRLQQSFPDLSYYDADLPLALRLAAAPGLFPLARCQVEANDQGQVLDLQVLDTPWELDPPSVPLRILELVPDPDPSHSTPRTLHVHFGRFDYAFPLDPPRPLLVNLAVLLRRHDPDLLLTTWGDTWLLPRLLELSQSLGLPLPLNRDERLPPEPRPEHTYFSYGQIVYRGAQVQLFGRWHIDRRNALLYDDYGLDGILEFARVTALPVQQSARLSPGTGISAMQIVTAQRHGIGVPWHKQQSERPKSALELMRRDQGGLIYQPITGLHRQVAELDFVSMYPSLMVRFNISPETAGDQPGDPHHLAPFTGPQPGLVPLTLAPLLEKRLALKARLLGLPRWDPRRPTDTARAASHKWLLVTCFGYLGYKNARFGRIEAHEAVTAYGREALLRAKESAEDLGGVILHMYVDGMWVQHPDWSTPQQVEPLLQEIATRTGLSINLEGIYRWVVFLPSRVDARISVANRYFGVYQDGSLKVRGIEARRRDTPPWITRVQLQLLETLAQAPSAEDLPAYLPAARRSLSQAFQDLRRGRVPLPDLLVAQKLSREVAAYRSPSPAARAAAQLQACGKTIRPGQRVRFLFTLGKPGVHAWDLPAPPDPRTVDVPRYAELLQRAADTILSPFIDESAGLARTFIYKISMEAAYGEVQK